MIAGEGYVCQRSGDAEGHKPSKTQLIVLTRENSGDSHSDFHIGDSQLIFSSTASNHADSVGFLSFGSFVPSL